MLLTSVWKPYRPLPVQPILDNDFTNLIDNFFNVRSTINQTVEVIDDKLIWSIDMPGVKVDDVDVRAVERTVTIGAKRDKRSYNVTYNVPREYDVDSIDVSLCDGVLVAKFAKLAELEPRKIKVKSL
jgi:HSP20 family molecular chaperone IbpA